MPAPVNATIRADDSIHRRTAPTVSFMSEPCQGSAKCNSHAVQDTSSVININEARICSTPDLKNLLAWMSNFPLVQWP